MSTVLVDRTEQILELVDLHGMSGEMDLGTAIVTPQGVVELMLAIQRLRLHGTVTDDDGEFRAERAEAERLRAELREETARADRHLANAQRYENEKYPACIDRAEAAEAEVERLRAALEFYADDANWTVDVARGESYCTMDFDTGARAKDALDSS